MKTNVQIIADHYAASAKKDIAGMMEDITPNTRWTEMAGFPCAGTWVGAEEIITNVFKVLAEEWNNFNFQLEQLIDGGEKIVGVGTYSGTYIKTGKSMDVRVTHLWHVIDGKIISFEQFTDTLLIAQAMQK